MKNKIKKIFLNIEYYLKKPFIKKDKRNRVLY